MNDFLSWVGRFSVVRGKISGTVVCTALAALFVMVALPRVACAQTLLSHADALPAAMALPDAPRPHTLGSISGTVHNAGGAPVGGVRVVLQGGKLPMQRIYITHRNGHFMFSHLQAGSYTVAASSPRIEPVSPTQIVLGTGEVFRLPITAIPMPKVVSTVQVRASLHEVAKAQVKQQVKQRVLAVIPNFDTSFVWDAAPMTPKLKFKLAARATFDPFTIFTDAALAGAEQYNDTYPGYGEGLEGYGKRFGATMADSFDARMLGEAALPSVFHQDPRYFYHGGPQNMRRFFYALKETVMCRGDNKRQQFCYSRILGDFAAAGISNVYHAPGDRGVSITVRDTFIILAGDAATNLMREFLSRGLTSHVPAGENGKAGSH